MIAFGQGAGVFFGVGAADAEVGGGLFGDVGGGDLVGDFAVVIGVVVGNGGGIAGDEAKGGGVGEDGGLELVMPDHEGLDACGDVVLSCHKLLVFSELGLAFWGYGPSPRPRGGRF